MKQAGAKSIHNKYLELGPCWESGQSETQWTIW